MAERTIGSGARDGATAEPDRRVRVAGGPDFSGTPRWVWAWALLLGFLLFLFWARTVLSPFIIAAALAYIFSMVVDRVQARLGWPRILVVTIFYVVVLGALGIALYFGGETLYQQSRDIVAKGPNVLETALKQFMGDNTYEFAGQTWDARLLAERITAALSDYLSNGGTGSAVHFASMLISRMLDTLLVIIVSFYLLLGGHRFGSYLLKFVPAQSREHTGYVAGRVHNVLGAYLRGQLLLIGLMSVVSFIVLQFIFNVPYALPLALVTGILEIIPLAGPIIAATLAASVALASHGAGAAVGVIIAYFILRELEDNFVVPMVVGRIVEIHPVVTIFAVLAGGAAAGVLGMVLAVPVTAAIKVLLDFLYPADPDVALEQAQRGLEAAQKEAATDDEGEGTGDTGSGGDTAQAGRAPASATTAKT
jgi:predicted PurR-regulated permease PerM